LTNASSKLIKAGLKGCIQLVGAFSHGRNALLQITLCTRGRRIGRCFSGCNLLFRKAQLWLALKGYKAYASRTGKRIALWLSG
jgi:hypothetical protein